MKAALIDGQIYLIMDRFEAQVVAAACNLAEYEWRKGDDYAQKMANICSRAEAEIVYAVFTQKSSPAVPNRTDRQNNNG